MASLQWFLSLSFAYVYKQNHQLLWRRAVPENIGPLSRISQPMKMQHLMQELLDDGYWAITINIEYYH